MNQTESLQKLFLHTFLPSFRWISNLLSLKVTDFTKASVITLTPSKDKEKNSSSQKHDHRNGAL